VLDIFAAFLSIINDTIDCHQHKPTILFTGFISLIVRHFYADIDAKRYHTSTAFD
jgi:hypothetical protein